MFVLEKLVCHASHATSSCWVVHGQGQVSDVTLPVVGRVENVTFAPWKGLCVNLSA